MAASKKRISLTDIARSLGVSKTLVSMVLNNRGDENGISKTTQQRVKDKAKELNYRPNQIARSLRLGRSNTIGLIVTDISNPFFARIARSIEDIAAKNNYTLILCSTDENPEKELQLIQMLKNRQVDGLIITSSLVHQKDLQHLRNDNFPVVLIDRVFSGMKMNTVSVNNYQGAFDGTSHLIRNGFDSIAFLSITPNHISTMKDRLNGYKDALIQHKIKPARKWIYEIDHKHIKRDVERSIKMLLTPPSRIRALFASNNNIAVACLETLSKRKIRIPHDLALLSFDDIDLFRFSYPPLTAISQPIEEIGKKTFELLLDEIMQKGENEKKQIVLPVSLIIRQSCGETFNF